MTLFGADAAKELLARASQKHEGKQGITMDDLEPLRVFAHLLNDADNMKVTGFMKSLGKSVKKAPPEKSKGAASSSNGASSKSGEGFAMKKAIKMFS